MGLCDGKTGQGYGVYDDRYLCNTIISKGAGFSHGSPWVKCYTNKKEIRTLTINEIRKAMGFPKKIKVNKSFEIASRLYGNAVVPMVVKQIVRQAFLPFLK